jgi:hypothetical protein
MSDEISPSLESWVRLEAGWRIPRQMGDWLHLNFPNFPLKFWGVGSNICCEISESASTIPIWSYFISLSFSVLVSLAPLQSARFPRPFHTVLSTLVDHASIPCALLDVSGGKGSRCSLLITGKHSMCISVDRWWIVPVIIHWKMGLLCLRSGLFMFIHRSGSSSPLVCC